MMDLHHTGSDKLLDIRTEKVDIVITTKRKERVCITDDDAHASSIKVVASNIEYINLPLQGMSEQYNEHSGFAVHELRIAPTFFEQTDYILTLKARSGGELEFYSNSMHLDKQIGYVIEDDKSLMTGVINFGNNVGYSDFAVIVDGKTIITFRVEVYPSKIDYRDDYRTMMSDINNMVSESILDFMRKTYNVFIPSHKKNEVPAVFFTILRSIFDKYIRAMNRIISVPHHKLISEYEVMPYHKVRRIDSRSEKWILKHPECVQRRGDIILADRVLSLRKRITYDTPENRLVKFMLQSTIKRMEDFYKRYMKTVQKPDPSVELEIYKMERELKRLISSHFFAEVSDYNASQSMSLVFGMAPGYRELYKYYLMLQSGISMGGDIFHMSVKDTAELYEYWCFIKLYSILKERYKLESPDIITVNRKGVTVDLAKGKSSEISFLNEETGEKITLAYNPTESETQTVNQRPDNVLELEKRGSKTMYKYVFDAKYRIETNPDEAHYPDKKPGPKVDDINTMHRYRDAIVYENAESRFTFEKTMFGAYILFPYSEEDEYKDHKFYRSIESVNIGGLPFLPSATKLVTELLDVLISDSSESAFERASLPVGIEDRIRTVDWEKRDVLIGLVPDNKHLNLFLKNNLFYTRKFDKDNLPIRYVALYEKGQGIQYYGEVISWRFVKSNTLPGMSERNKEYCNVFEVLKWEKLPEMISMEETGPNPIAYTNFFLLSTSKKYSELRLKSEAEYRLFMELRRRAEARIIDEDNNFTTFESGDSKLLFDDTDITVIRAGEVVGSSTIAEFNTKPNRTFRILRHYMEII